MPRRVKRHRKAQHLDMQERVRMRGQVGCMRWTSRYLFLGCSMRVMHLGSFSNNGRSSLQGEAGHCPSLESFRGAVEVFLSGR
jgi:hypothetical protein